MPKFVIGQSGNPAGRKAGTPNKMSRDARRILEANATAVLEATVQSALDGDNRAQQIILGLALPKRVRASIDLPDLDRPEAVSVSLAILVDRLAQGAIEPEEARTLAQVLEVAGRHFDAEARMAGFFDSVLEAIAAESPETARRITEKLSALQKFPANGL